MPLYISLLFKIMKEQGTHEGCIEQIYKLYKDHLCVQGALKRDSEGYIRIDDLEMQPDVQAKIAALWPTVASENVKSVTDLEGYCDDFYRLFGFNLPGVDYEKEVDPVVKVGSIG